MVHGRQFVGSVSGPMGQLCGQEQIQLEWVIIACVRYVYSENDEKLERNLDVLVSGFV